MTKSINQQVTLNATPARVYEALMSSAEHTAFTGAPATIDARVGGVMTAYGDALHAVNVELVAGKRIVQAWKGCMFPDGAFSILTIELEAAGDGTLLTMAQHGVPDSVYDVINPGWDKSYWSKLKAYFA
jgi:activator of HSP90 ATPase